MVQELIYPTKIIYINKETGEKFDSEKEIDTLKPETKNWIIELFNN